MRDQQPDITRSPEEVQRRSVSDLLDALPEEISNRISSSTAGTDISLASLEAVVPPSLSTGEAIQVIQTLCQIAKKAMVVDGVNPDIGVQAINEISQFSMAFAYGEPVPATEALEDLTSLLNGDLPGMRRAAALRTLADVVSSLSVEVDEPSQGEMNFTKQDFAILFEGVKEPLIRVALNSNVSGEIYAAFNAARGLFVDAGATAFELSDLLIRRVSPAFLPRALRCIDSALNSIEYLGQDFEKADASRTLENNTLAIARRARLEENTSIQAEILSQLSNSSKFTPSNQLRGYVEFFTLTDSRSVPPLSESSCVRALHMLKRDNPLAFVILKELSQVSETRIPLALSNLRDIA